MPNQTKRSAGKNHPADIKNANKGTTGANITYDKNQGNRGTQLNPNHTPTILRFYFAAMSA